MSGVGDFDCLHTACCSAAHADMAGVAIATACLDHAFVPLLGH